MFEKLGKKKFAVPFVVPVLLIRLFALMFYPMANMELKHMPFAVVCLDEGADLPTGSVNAGQQMKDQAADAALEQMLAQAGGSQAAQAQAAGDVSAAQAAAAAQAGSGSEAAQQAQARQAQMQAEQQLLAAADGVSEEDFTLHVYLDKAKSPLIAQQLQSSMASMFAQRGIAADVQVVNDGGLESSGPAMGSMLSQQLSILPPIMCSFIVALVAAAFSTCTRQIHASRQLINWANRLQCRLARRWLWRWARGAPSRGWRAWKCRLPRP